MLLQSEIKGPVILCLLSQQLTTNNSSSFTFQLNVTFQNYKKQKYLAD